MTNKNKEKLSTESYKGVRDFYPENQAFLNYFIATVRNTVERMGYVEYAASILEPSELYRAKGAENEEMVNEQTYTFTDRGERQVTLRPEMTPTAARMVAGKRRELGYPLRWYSIPNCFRYERPQRGRLREFWQPNIDIFGSTSIASDVEVLTVGYEILRAFGAQENDFVIKVGDRTYIDEIALKCGLSDEQKGLLLGLLDRKAKIPVEEFERGLKELGVEAELLSPNTLPPTIAKILADLEQLGIGNVVYDPSIVRGFAYYTGMVFEAFDTNSENSRAIMGGGRYDNLTQLFDDEPLPGVGFAFSDAGISNFLEVHNLLPTYHSPTQVYIAIPSNDLAVHAQKFASELRKSGVNVAIDFGDKKLADQIKAAHKHKIPHLIVVGENELSSGEFVVRDLVSGAESTHSRAMLASFFLSL